MAYQTRKFLEESSDKVSTDVKTKVEEAAAKVDEALKGEDIEAIKSAVEELAKESQEMGKAIYEAEQNAGATQAEGSDNDVVDAEVVDDEEEKK